MEETDAVLRFGERITAFPVKEFAERVLALALAGSASDCQWI
jgi:hypothetical protein